MLRPLVDFIPFRQRGDLHCPGLLPARKIVAGLAGTGDTPIQAIRLSSSVGVWQGQNRASGYWVSDSGWYS